MNKHTVVAAVVALGVLAGCQDLDVTNPNDPDRERALSSPADIQALVFGSWQGNFWGRTQLSSSSVNAMPNIADEMTATYANNASLELSSEPRIALNNNPLSDAHGIPRFQWEDWYAGLSNANDGLRAIVDGLVIVVNGEDVTAETRAFAKFMQGVSLGYLGMLFDQGFIVKEDTDVEDPRNLTLQPYDVVMAEAIESLEEAIDLARNAPPFDIPPTVVSGVTIDNALLQRMAHSFIARILVYGARTPEERAAVDWAAVIQHVDAGIQQDFAVELTSQVQSLMLLRYQSNGSFQGRADSKLIGWADTSGRFQAWLNTPVAERNKFLIETPDRRITGPGGPTTNGKYFEYLTVERFRPERGTYHFSWYQWNGEQGRFETGTHRIIRLAEMRLFKAEALLRSGQAAAAASIVNETRVANGELPPVTATGVTAAANCVPRTATGGCGDLMWALYYERQIESAGTDALRAYLDKRGFGTLTEGTFFHLPIPARELENLGLSVYTFGGPGGVGSARTEVGG